MDGLDVNGFVVGVKGPAILFVLFGRFKIGLLEIDNLGIYGFDGVFE
jgi:hypothetical protein